MNYKYSKHADDQISKRSISKKKIAVVIDKPDNILIYDNCLKVCQKVFEEKENKYLYRIFVNICKEPALIITAYKTSKIKKYEDKI